MRIQPHNLNEILPSYIQKELMIFTFKNTITSIKLLSANLNFSALILPYSSFLSVKKNEIIYREEESSEESFI